MANQLFYGSLYGMPQGNSSNSVIRVSGNISGNTITGTAVSGYLGLDSAAVGMVVRWGSNTRTITAVNVGSIEVDGAALTASATFRISPAEGNYYVSASIFSDPNNEITVNNITGSLDNDFDSKNDNAFAVLAAADGVNGRFHQYKISQVVTRSLGDSKISFFMDWNESGSEADSGDTLATNLQYMGIGEVTNKLGISPTFNRRVGDLTNLQVGADQAGFQVIAQELDDFSTGSFTGSFFGFFSGSGTINNAETASSADDFKVRGNLTVIGTGSFGFFHTIYQSSSIIFSSGSTKFGDTTNDTHNFTGSISSFGGLVDFTDATGVEGDFSGSFEGDGNGLTNVEFSNIVNKPTLLSSSAQIADDISGSFVTPSASIDTRITNVSSSIANTIDTLDTRVTNVSASFSTDVDTLDTRVTNVSASFSTTITNIETGDTTITSASYAITASYAANAVNTDTASFVETLNQDVAITGSLFVSGSETNNDASVIVRNGYVYLENIPEFTSVTDAINAGLPSNAVFKINLGGLTDGGNTARFLMIID